MKINKHAVALQKTYEEIKTEIGLRVKNFEDVFNKGSETKVFRELVFCLCTPQSKARYCEEAVALLEKNGLLLKGSAEEVKESLPRVRFAPTKSKRILEAREQFAPNGKVKIKKTISSFDNERERREWFQANIKGFGYKEASHFLRNIGMGKTLAILDRHVLRHLVKLEVISEEPKTISKKLYIDTENKMQEFCKKINVPLEHFDFVMLYDSIDDTYIWK